MKNAVVLILTVKFTFDKVDFASGILLDNLNFSMTKSVLSFYKSYDSSVYFTNWVYNYNGAFQKRRYQDQTFRNCMSRIAKIRRECGETYLRHKTFPHHTTRTYTF